MKTLLLLFMITLSAAPAHAVMISNSDDVPHQLTVRHPDYTEEYTILPGSFLRVYGPGMKLRLNGGADERVRGEHDRYVIWPDGKMYIQKRTGSAPGNIRFN